MTLDAEKLETRSMDWLTVVLSNIVTVLVIFYGHHIFTLLRDHLRNITDTIVATLEPETPPKG